ncbi:hypothetical protein BDV95DRAFT_118092 [Massariosphaeria phaeospora]|uniref:Uncharacterized protein n=1 Tax=Massariosphaeria phaeospora TaxID=100035 RepID=A0A7C8I1V1_9PLEO|nr:hypothetical protein BDV95DRAFT_118092 [Massariosphaeria phaeospora]
MEKVLVDDSVLSLDASGNIVPKTQLMQRPPMMAFHTPRTVWKMIKAVCNNESSTLCTCNKYSPDLYLRHKSLHSSNRINYLCGPPKGAIWTNRFGINGLVGPTYDREGEYEAMHLARVSIDYFGGDVDTALNQRTLYRLSALQRMNETQLSAIDRLKSNMAAWGDALNAPDPRGVVSPQQMCTLIDIFSDIFFFGALPLGSEDFEWITSSPPRTIYGEATIDPKSSRLLIKFYH